MNLRLTWDKWYELAQLYYEKHGDLEVPTKFRTNDGFTYNKNGCIRLGIWINNQRHICDIESECGQKLLKIGMRFDKKALTWEEAYEKAVEFYVQYKHLMVPRTFKTVDGFNLGLWISNQRSYYGNNDLSPEKIYLLESIGMVWGLKENRFKIVLLCDENNIDIPKNKSVLLHMSAVELEFKLNFIRYLKDEEKINIDIVDENGLLNEFFSMTCIEIEFTYINSLDEFYIKYNKNSVKTFKKNRI